MAQNVGNQGLVLLITGVSCFSATNKTTTSLWGLILADPEGWGAVGVELPYVERIPLFKIHFRFLHELMN